jgi:tetratricopeptide (TPR) repeat protein
MIGKKGPHTIATPGRPPARDGLDAEVSSAFVSREEGAELARGLLEWTGWTQAQLALALRAVAREGGLSMPGVDRFTVNRWTTGRQRPTRFYVSLLIRLLYRLMTRSVSDAELAARLHGQRRRVFLLRLAGSAGFSTPSAGVPGSLAAGPEEQWDTNSFRVQTAMGYFDRLLPEFISADGLLGSRMQLPAVISHFEMIHALLPQARFEDAARLLGLAARYAELAGWLHQDSGQLRAATRWTDRALEFARASQDVSITSYVLARQSMQAAARRDASSTISLARAAQEPSRLPPRIRAVALIEEGYGLALAGRTQEWQPKLEEAATIAGALIDRDDEAMARYCIPEFVEIWRATSLLESGRCVDAIDVFHRAIAALPPHYYRDRGNYLGRLGAAYAAEGEPEVALRCGREAHEIAMATGSSWIGGELAKLHAKLQPWSDRPEVMEFQQAAAAPVPSLNPDGPPE